MMGLVLGPASCAPDPRTSAVWGEIGEPVPGLTADELGRFQAGKAVFSKPFTAREGLGPRFNENACNACHTDPADGGTGEQLVLKASRVDMEGRCEPMSADGGENLRRQVTEAAAAQGAAPVPTPTTATHSGRLNTPFIFGMGLLDAIPLSALEAHADPDDADGDGISGRIGTDARGRPARFGRKANVATLRDFVDEAFRMEMGLTTPDHPDEGLAGALPPAGTDVDPVPEPEVDAEAFAATVDFVRFLAPPAPRADADADPSTQRGQTLFTELGCASCHLPQLPVGPDAPSAYAGRSVALYSDLLLHDLGPDLAGHCTATAGPSEFRTEPLMGLRYRSVYLHDGRAGRVRDAILSHGGEAANARAAFSALDRLTQEALLAFLRTL